MGPVTYQRLPIAVRPAYGPLGDGHVAGRLVADAPAAIAGPQFTAASHQRQKRPKMAGLLGGLLTGTVVSARAAGRRIKRPACYRMRPTAGRLKIMVAQLIKPRAAARPKRLKLPWKYRMFYYR